VAEEEQEFESDEEEEVEKQVISIDSEAAAWATLEGLLDGSLNPDAIELDFSAADWAQLHIIFRGHGFQQSLTPTVMKGLIEFQASLYKTVANLLKDDPRGIRLSNEERELFELNFKVSAGSSDLQAPGKDTLLELASKALESMNSGHKLIAILVMAGLYFGTPIAQSLVSNDLEKVRIEAAKEKDQRKDDAIAAALADSAKKTAILEKALNQSDKIAAIQRDSTEAYKALVKGADEAESVQIQGFEITEERISELNKSTRRRAKKVVFTAAYKIVNVEPKEDSGFVIRLRRTDNGDEITAKITDAIASDRFTRIVSRAEWKKAPINVKISARRFGDEIRDAEVIKVSAIRGPRKKDEATETASAEE
jgi:hypothetical protein